MAHGLIGALVVVGFTIAAVLEARRRPSDAFERLVWMLYLLPLPLLQLLTAYGLFRRKRWGCLLALVFSLLYVFVFPLGTLLAVYTYWFLHSAGARQLYAKPVG